jgi:hypothetical protein
MGRPFISWRSGGAVPRRKNPAISEHVSAGQIAEDCGQLPEEMMALFPPQPHDRSRNWHAVESAR